MSLLRLLTAGRSLIGLKESARYREAGPRALPKFELKMQPSRPASEPDTSPEPSVAAPLPARGIGDAQSPSGWFARWAAKWRRPKSSAIPRFNKPLVQGELSLDRVKVLRNDLSESDLEVVPARTAVTKGPGRSAANPGGSAAQATTPELLPVK